MSKPDTLTLQIKTRPVTYGDGAKYHEWVILMLHRNKVVGAESGPRRATPDRASCTAAARSRIRELQKHRLYVIRITRDDMRHGKARSCETCPVAQALYRNQERMGLDKYDYDWWVETYRAYVHADGLVLNGPDGSLHIDSDDLPLIINKHNPGLSFFQKDLSEWTQDFDEWKDMVQMGVREWREERGYEDGERAYRPLPFSFVLDMDAMKPTEK